jgi:hypothetical protein
VVVDSVHFALLEGGGAASEAQIAIRVNGRPLQDWAADVERPYAEAEGHPDIAGGYAGLAPRAVLLSALHFFGQPHAVWFEDGDTVLLGCGCGEWGCWPLTADIEISEEQVVWRNFRNGHRDSWDHSTLGPFTFGRSQYQSALLDLNDALRRHNP